MQDARLRRRGTEVIELPVFNRCVTRAAKGISGEGTLFSASRDTEDLLKTKNVLSTGYLHIPGRRPGCQQVGEVSQGTAHYLAFGICLPYKKGGDSEWQ